MKDSLNRIEVILIPYGPRKLSEQSQLTFNRTFFIYLFFFNKLWLQSDKCMKFDEKMSRSALGYSKEADLVEIRDFSCLQISCFFFSSSFSLHSLPSVLQNNLWSAQFSSSSRRQTDGQTDSARK